MADRDLGSSTKFWIGVVINAHGDPLKSGRVQIRVIGRHDDTTNIPDNTLPWAVSLHRGPTIGGMGRSEFYVKGTQVMGFWMDKDYQIPIIMGTVPKSGHISAEQATTVDGYPLIDYLRGSSIPNLSSGHNTSIHTVLNPNRRNITSINDGLTIWADNIRKNDGVIYSDVVQALFSIPLFPTTASIHKKSSSDVLRLVKQVDPLFTSSSLSCMIPNFIGINNILGLLGSGLIGLMTDALISALKGALLAIAAKLGLFKLLNMLNKALGLASNVLGLASQILSMINSFSNKLCLPIPALPKIPNIPNVPNILINAIARVMYELNSAVGWAVGSVNNTITAVGIAAAETLLDNNAQISYRIASVRTPYTRSPLAVVIVLIAPPRYTQVYYADSDPYPGYIEWEDPDHLLPNNYTIRNGEPLFSSAQQHTEYVMKNTMIAGLGPSMLSGNIASFAFGTITSLVSNAISVGSVFAASKIIGAGLSALGGISMLKLIAPNIAMPINAVYTPQLLRSINIDITGPIISKFAQQHAVLAIMASHARPV